MSSASVSASGSTPVDPWKPIPIQGRVDTAREALGQLLNQYKGDLDQLNVYDLDDAISTVRQVKNLTAKEKQALDQLIDLRDGWQADLSSAATQFQRNTIDAKYRAELDRVFKLDAQTSNTVSLEVSLKLSELLAQGTSNWSQTGNTQTVEQVNALLVELNKLSPTTLKALGMDTFKAGLDAALAGYNEAMKAIPADSQPDARRLAENKALSSFRCEVAKVRINLLSTQGGPEAQKAIARENRILNQEKLWLDNLNTPWQTEKFKLLPALPNAEGLTGYNEDLKALREQEMAKGNTVGVAYLDARIAIVDRTINELRESGTTKGMAAQLTFLNMASELTGLDLTDANAMLEKAKAASADAKTDAEKQANRDMIKGFEELVNRITEIMGLLTKLTKDMADRFYESVQSIR